MIEDHTFRRIGGNELIQVDVRIISATNKELTKEVAAGRFREDLFYRLSVFPIQLPALRERVKDIEELALYFLQKSSAETGKEAPTAFSGRAGGDARVCVAGERARAAEHAQARRAARGGGGDRTGAPRA